LAGAGMSMPSVRGIQGGGVVISGRVARLVSLGLCCPGWRGLGVGVEWTWDGMGWC